MNETTVQVDKKFFEALVDVYRAATGFSYSMARSSDPEERSIAFDELRHAEVRCWQAETEHKPIAKNWNELRAKMSDKQREEADRLAGQMLSKLEWKPKKTRLTDEELERTHAPIICGSVHGRKCNCLVPWVKKLQEEADVLLYALESMLRIVSQSEEYNDPERSEPILKDVLFARKAFAHSIEAYQELMKEWKDPLGQSSLAELVKHLRSLVQRKDPKSNRDDVANFMMKLVDGVAGHDVQKPVSEVGQELHEILHPKESL